MKLRVMVEVSHQGVTKRILKSVEVPAKTVKLHAMMCEDVGVLREAVAADVMSHALSAVSGPAAQKLDSTSMISEAVPGRAGKARTAADKKMSEMLGLDLLEHIDKVDGKSPLGKPPLGGGRR